MAGSHYSFSGGGTTRLCMPNDPDYTLPFISGVQSYSSLFPVEYQFTVKNGAHDIPCAVCVVPTKDLVLMVPGKSSCPAGFTREYYMATLCRRGCTLVIIDLHSNALTKISSLYVEAQLKITATMLSSVMLRLNVMHYLALPTTRSTVLCAQCSCSVMRAECENTELCTRILLYIVNRTIVVDL